MRGDRLVSESSAFSDEANGVNVANDSATLNYMKATFTDHYNGNRQPIGLYTHPIHLAKSYPGIRVSQSTIDMINAFLDWAQEQQNGLRSLVVPSSNI